MIIRRPTNIVPFACFLFIPFVWTLVWKNISAKKKEMDGFLKPCYPAGWICRLSNWWPWNCLSSYKTTQTHLFHSPLNWTYSDIQNLTQISSSLKDKIFQYPAQREGSPRVNITSNTSLDKCAGKIPQNLSVKVNIGMSLTASTSFTFNTEW